LGLLLLNKTKVINDKSIIGKDKSVLVEKDIYLIVGFGVYNL